MGAYREHLINFQFVIYNFETISNLIFFNLLNKNSILNDEHAVTEAVESIILVDGGLVGLLDKRLPG